MSGTTAQQVTHAEGPHILWFSRAGYCSSATPHHHRMIGKTYSTTQHIARSCWRLYGHISLQPYSPESAVLLSPDRCSSGGVPVLQGASTFRLQTRPCECRSEAFGLQSGLWGALKSKLLWSHIQGLYTHSSRTLVKSMTIKLRNTCTGVSLAFPCA